MKIKEYLRENRFHFKYDTVKNFEEDLNKIHTKYWDLKKENDILRSENETMGKIINDFNDRYNDNAKLLKFENLSINERKAAILAKEQEGEKKRNSKNPHEYTGSDSESELSFSEDQDKKNKLALV